eukprot:1153320-Pelagomonas_calceolata.AAC.1
MGIWRVARHAPGRPDSPSPVLHRRVPSNTLPEAPVKTKSVSSVKHDISLMRQMSLLFLDACIPGNGRLFSFCLALLGNCYVWADVMVKQSWGAVQMGTPRGECFFGHHQELPSLGSRAFLRKERKPTLDVTSVH